jgi:acetyltransferase-like isoleucine patch superfamily enzyme
VLVFAGRVMFRLKVAPYAIFAGSPLKVGRVFVR